MDATIRRDAGVAPQPVVTIEAPAAIQPVGERDQDEVERELRLVDAAISMVRRGVARRITLASLPLGHAVVHAAQSRGALYGLQVQAVRDADDEPIALLVERPAS